MTFAKIGEHEKLQKKVLKRLMLKTCGLIFVHMLKICWLIFLHMSDQKKKKYFSIC